jgi:hypothetical protein
MFLSSRAGLARTCLAAPRLARRGATRLESLAARCAAAGLCAASNRPLNHRLPSATCYSHFLPPSLVYTALPAPPPRPTSPCLVLSLTWAALPALLPSLRSDQPSLSCVTMVDQKWTGTDIDRRDMRTLNLQQVVRVSLVSLLAGPADHRCSAISVDLGCLASPQLCFAPGRSLLCMS